MNTLIFHALSALFSLFAKGTVLLLAAWTACLLLRRASAATRHLIWAAALVAVLLLPVLSLSLPRWNVAVAPHATVSPAAPPLAATPVPSADAPLGGADKTPALSPAPSSEQTTRSGELNSSAVVLPPKTKRSYSTLLVCTAVAISAWLIGFILIVVQFFVGLWQIERIRKQALPLDGAVLGIAQDVQRRFGIPRVTFLRASDKSGVAVPVTWGLFRPTVLLPEQSVSWSEECLQAALLHELAHIQRWDWAMQVTARLACALYWWHPIVWFAAKQARAESERACDDLVLGTGVKAADYAQRLVEVVRSMPAGSQFRSVAIAMAQPSEVEGRLRAVLAKGCSRRPLTRRQTIGSFVVVMLLTLPLAAFCLTPSVQAHGTVLANTTRNAAADRIIVADGHVAIVDGDRALFPGGYEVSLVGVTQAARTGDEWDMFAGPWWRPDGTSIAPQSGGLNGHWHWSVARTHGLAPFIFKVVFHTPRSAWKQGESSAGGFFQQFLGAFQPAENSVEGHVVTNGLHPTDRYFTSPLVDGSSPQRFGGAVGGTRCAELYPIGTRACTVRFGVAAGPWRTAATHPFSLTPALVTPDLSQSARYQTDVSLSLDEHPRETYLDAQGKPRVFYFLGSKAVLPNVARRFVAVDTAGHSVPLSEFGKQNVALAFGHSDVTKWNPHVDLSKIKEFRLQTCPYKTVEFRNIQLQPAAETGSLLPSSATLLAQASTHQLEQARQLRAHLQPWAQNNKALLQKMAQAQPNDMTTLMQVYTSFQHLPFPLWGGDPRMGQGGEDAPFANDLPSHLTLTHLQRSQDFTETRVRRDFIQLHDLAMVQSVNAGRSHVTVWASGRITQTMETDKFMGHGQPIGTVESQNPAVLTFKDHPIVVVDPGHGGQDAGAIGASGVTKKALNLQIAQQLRAELERRGAVVYLTRDGDTSLPIMGRSQFGVERHADYFISLHCDLWPQRTSATPQRQDTEGQGTLAYYHGQDPNARRLAEDISLKIGQVSASFPNRTLSDRGRFPTGFGVLRNASMPAVLIECGYMDNVHDLKRLRDPQRQQRIVEGIAEGLIIFRGRG